MNSSFLSCGSRVDSQLPLGSRPHYITRQFSGMPVVSGCLLLLFAVSSFAGDSWPNYRGPSRQGLSDAENLPTQWSEDRNVAWKVAIKGKAWSTPVISQNRIWLTNAPPEGTRLSAICIDTQSGKTINTSRLRSTPAPQYCHPFNSYASPSPVIEDGRVYVSFGSPFIGCLDSSSGKVIWERTDLVCNHFRGPGSSPFLYEDLLIQHFDGSDEQYVVALDKETGKTIWRTDRSVDFKDIVTATGKPEREGDWRKAYSTPMIIDVGGRPILVSLGSKALYGYDPRDGQEVWRFEFFDSHSGACRPVIGQGLIFVPIGSGGELWAVRPDGQGVVTDTHVEWKYSRAVPRRPSVLLVDDLLFMVNDDGIAACVEAKSGNEVWRKRLGGGFSASPIHAAGKIYFFDQDGKSTIIEASRDFRVVSENQLDDGLMASPAVSGNALFIRTKTHLYRIENEVSS